MEKAITKDGLRQFTCKRCGCRASENVYVWRKKPQEKKNICLVCLDRQATAVQGARERAQYAGYGILR